MESLKETSLHLLASAHAVSTSVRPAGAGAGVGGGDDWALRDVLAAAAQQCALASLGVLRNLAEELELCVLSSDMQLLSPSQSPTSDQDKWLGVVSFVGEHVVRFLASSLSSSQGRVTAGSACLDDESAVTAANSFQVLEALFSEFPDHVVVIFLNQLCKIMVRGVGGEGCVCGTTAPPVISKSLVFTDADDDDDCTDTLLSSSADSSFHFIEEIIRCCACSAAASSSSSASSMSLS
jgi:hypothetical protein